MSAAADREAVFESILQRSRSADLGGDGTVVDENFLRSYYQLVPTDRLQARRAEDLVGSASSHRELAQCRQPGEDLVRISNPTVSRDGWSVGATIIETVTDDRAFLVDAVRGLLESRGHRVQELIHPIFSVDRDEEGALVSVTHAPTAAHDDVPAAHADTQESWMHVEIPRVQDPAAMSALQEALKTSLQDIRMAVADWGEMSSQMWQVANSVQDREEAQLLRWLTDEEFTFLGRMRYTIEKDASGQPRLEPDAESARGICRRHPEFAFLPLDTEDRLGAWSSRQVMVLEGSHRSEVQRSMYHDVVSVKEADEQGEWVAEERFVGLLASTVSSGSTARIPMLRRVTTTVLQELGIARESHAGREVMQLIDDYPRRTLFQVDPRAMAANALEIRQLREHPRARLFVDIDPLQRFVTFVVYLPRDRYSTQSRLAITELLRDAVNGVDVDFQTQVSGSPLAALHFTIRVPEGTSVPEIDREALERRLDEIGRDWREEFRLAVDAEFGEEEGEGLSARYAAAFPSSYTETTSPRVGAWDTRQLDRIHHEGMQLSLYRPAGAVAGARRLKLYLPEAATLSTLLPLFNDLGVVVTDEHPYEVQPQGGPSQYLLDLGLKTSESNWTRTGDAAERFQEAVRAAWTDQIESDPLQALVLSADLTARQVVILRAITLYLRQLGVPYSPSHLQQVLNAYPATATALVELFEARFTPEGFSSEEERQKACDGIIERIAGQLEEVPLLDHERILGACRDIILACLRTSFYQPDAEGRARDTIAFKLDTEQLTFAPQPRPHREIWVYGPRVEGVHLRFGSVARGGLRWSDRREDFRTEVLGLVKAQVVKNAVIVPAGAKGGFYAKKAGSPVADRDAWFAEGTSAYKSFIDALLSVTDNREGVEIVPPADVVRHDEDDPYLVVAADKGTATFSDTANRIALDRGFWLGDAFASGGSAGFDHKGMGITARGAWESVKRHFRERDLDTQSEDFTVVGIGDMSGDVFGNGMLCSEHIRLVAAFDHRHVFVDPNPDAASGFQERRRLFDKPRSSWNDYDRSLISEGGGVWSRNSKSISISSQMREALGIEAPRLSPAELIKAILQAPVDLLWNGGIGTYVKSSAEQHSDVGDRANDAVRINGEDLRVKVVGEGGNLGFTQRGRVEAALNGVAINTDAIDNSAGVDTSDHEVNIKIVLGEAVRAGDLTGKQRDKMLADMVDEVAGLVLRTNYEQNVLIGNARTQGERMVSPHIRLMHHLEETVGLNRDLEALPTDEALRTRAKRDHKGLTSPEFSVLVAWTKIGLKQALLQGTLVDDPWCEGLLMDYFPKTVVDRFGDLVRQHPLRREIIANVIANEVVNRGGVTFVFRAMEESSHSVEDIIRGFLVAREVFGLSDFTRDVETLDNKVATAVQADLYLGFRKLLDQAARRLAARRAAELEPEMERYADVKGYFGSISKYLNGSEIGEFERRHTQLVEAGVPEKLAVHAGELPAAFALLDVVDLAEEHEVEREVVARTWFGLVDLLQVGDLLSTIAALEHADQWDAMARNAARSDAYQILMALTDAVLAIKSEDRLATWAEQHAAARERAVATVRGAVERSRADLAPVSVALRALRDLRR